MRENKYICKKPGVYRTFIIILVATFFTFISSLLVMKLTGAMKNINVTLVITYGLLVGISIGIIISFVLYILCRNNETESTTPENINKKRNPRWCKDKSWLWLWTPLVLGIIFGTFGGYTYGKGYNLATMYSLIGFIIGISAPLITSAIIIISSCNN